MQNRRIVTSDLRYYSSISMAEVFKLGLGNPGCHKGVLGVCEKFLREKTLQNVLLWL